MKNVNKFWRKLSWHNGLDACRLSEFYLKICIFYSLSKINLRNFQGRKSACVCQHLVMRTNFDPKLNVSNWKTICSTHFEFRGCFDQGLCHACKQFRINLSCIAACIDLLVMLSWIARIKFGWNFASNIKAFFFQLF